MKNNVCTKNVTRVFPELLSDAEFRELYEVTQDMWAYGIWELIQCNKCSEIHWKKEIFWWLTKELYETTVANIMRILDIDTISCPSCSWETRFIYWPNHIENIRNKLLTSDFSRISLVRDEWKIVGTGLYYKETFKKIFDYELEDHYGTIWLDAIHERIKNILWWKPQKMIAFSTIGFIEKYKNPFHFFEILRSAAETLWEIWESIPWIMELDTYNPIHKVFMSSWGISLEVKKMVNNRISNTSKTYDSDLIILPDSLKTFQESFARWPRAFLRKLIAT